MISALNASILGVYCDHFDSAFYSRDLEEIVYYYYFSPKYEVKKCQGLMSEINRDCEAISDIESCH